MPAQQAIRRWFDRTYSSAGLSYLRPAEFYSIFLEYLQARPGDRLLDVGCGPGLLLAQAARHGVRPYGVDISVVGLSMARRQTPGAGVGLCNAERLCYGDAFFDHLTCIGVFEHCLDADATLAEMQRVTKPDGRICIMVPNCRTLKWKIEAGLLRCHDEDSNERAATLEEWREIFLRNGLRIERIQRDEWPAYARRRRLLGRRAGEFTAARRPRHLLPLRYANQFVFLMRPAPRAAGPRLHAARARQGVLAGNAERMLIQALLPGIHQRPTGGNLFNRRILDVLENVADVERRVVAESTPLPAAAVTPPADRPAVTLIDSLLLVAAADYLRDAPGPHVLVAHYLHLFEPGRRGSPEAERERALLPRLDGVVTTSKHCRDVLLGEGFDDRRLAVVTPGLAPCYTLAAASRGPATPRLLTVSSWIPGKGLRQLLEILETLADLEWTWELAGDPELDRELSASLRRRVERSPVAGRIRLHGAVDPDRMVDLYDRCHVFVLPSRFETCSMATMEAMCRALPVAAYRVGGLPERLPEETAHLLAPPGDRERMASNLRRLLTQRTAAAHWGRVNREASRGFPSWQESGAVLGDFLHRLADRSF